MTRGRKVELTQLNDADSGLLFIWINEREEVLKSAPYKPIHEPQHQHWFSSLTDRRDLAIFGIREIGTSRLVGTCQLHSISHVHRSAELQIRIGDVGSRGQGFGYEAVQLLVRFGFADLNLDRIFLSVFETNAAATKVYEKVGFKREGLLREAVHLDGRKVDLIVMGLLSREYDWALPG